MHLNQLKRLSRKELIKLWSQEWDREAPPKISRRILELSLKCRLNDRNGSGLSQSQKSRLKTLITNYKNNPGYFKQKRHRLKPGIRIVRRWNGQDIIVKVLKDGFELKGVFYSSLSKIATKVTGTQRNGWRFFKIASA